MKKIPTLLSFMSLATGSFALPQSVDASEYANKVKRKKTEPNLKRSPKKRFMSEQTKMNLQSGGKTRSNESIRRSGVLGKEGNEIIVSSKTVLTQH